MRDDINTNADYLSFRCQIIDKFGQQYYDQQEIFFIRAVELANKGLHYNALVDCNFALQLSHYSNDPMGAPYLTGLLSQLYCDLDQINAARVYYEQGMKLLDPEDEDYSEVIKLFNDLKEQIDGEGWKGDSVFAPS